MRMVGLMHDESEFKPTSRSTIRAKVNKTEPKKACSATSSPYIVHLRLNLPQDLRSVPFQIPDFRLNLHQARRRRPGRAPRTCSRTPSRGAVPPRDEIPLRNNLERRRGAWRDAFGNCGPPRILLRPISATSGTVMKQKTMKQKRTHSRFLPMTCPSRPMTRLSRSAFP